MTAELKPCPFCGSKKVELRTWIENGYVEFSGYCHNCHSQSGKSYEEYSREIKHNTDLHESAEKTAAIKLWNTRNP